MSTVDKITADDMLRTFDDAGIQQDRDSMTCPSIKTRRKRKRVVLSIHDKHQVLQRLELGEQPLEIARDFGISKQQVSDIKKNRQKILSVCVDAKHLSTLRKKTLKATAGYHLAVEQELYRWLIRQRKLGRIATYDMLFAKATELFHQYSLHGSRDSQHLICLMHSRNVSPAMDAVGDDRVGGPVHSKDVESWLCNFRIAHNIRTMSVEELKNLSEDFKPAMDAFIKPTHVHENTFSVSNPGRVDIVCLEEGALEAEEESQSQIDTKESPCDSAVCEKICGVLQSIGAATSVPAASSIRADVGEQSSTEWNCDMAWPYFSPLSASCVDSLGSGSQPTSLESIVASMQRFMNQVAVFEHNVGKKLTLLSSRLAVLQNTRNSDYKVYVDDKL